MPIQKTTANYFNFVGGLDTESSVLNRDPASVTSISNCIINDDGSIESRYGMETLEVDQTFFNVGAIPNVQSWNWNYIYENLRKYYQLIKVSENIYVYEGNISELTSLDQKGIIYTNYSPTDTIDLAFNENRLYFVSTVEGLLYIDVHEINTYGNLVSTVGGKIIQRKEVTVDANYNSSWPDGQFEVEYDAPDNLVFFDAFLANGSSIKLNFRDGSSRYSIKKETYTGMDVTTGYRGVILEDSIDMSGIDSVSLSIPVYVEDGLTSTTSCYFGLGRLVLGGFKYKTNRVYYSQIIENDEDITKFHQEANPFSPTDSLVVATDGGYFDIKGAGSIIGITEISGSYIILCDNGIWEATGIDGIFKGDDYSVNQITNKGCVSKDSITKVGNSVVYAGNSGIYVISKDESGLFSKVNSLTDAKIKSFYTNLPTQTKANIKTTYDFIKDQIIFLYGSTREYNNILIYNIKNKNWTLWGIKGDNISIGNVYMSPYNKKTLEAVTTDGTTEVVDDSGDTVYVYTDTFPDERYVPSCIYHRYNTNNESVTWSFGRLQGDNIVDFKDAVYEEFNTSSLTSAHQTYGDTLRNKQANYIKCIFEVIEDGNTNVHGYYDPGGECKLRLSLDFAEDPVLVLDEFGNLKQLNTNYGRKQNVYPKYRAIKSLSGDLTSGYSHVTSKNKVLGRGNILQFNFFNEESPRYFKALSSTTGNSPILDTTNTYWEEISKEDFSGSEWKIDTSYSKNDTVKVTRFTRFKLIGWSSELIVTQGTS